MAKLTDLRPLSVTATRWHIDWCLKSAEEERGYWWRGAGAVFKENGEALRSAMRSMGERQRHSSGEWLWSEVAYALRAMLWMDNLLRNGWSKSRVLGEVHSFWYEQTGCDPGSNWPFLAFEMFVNRRSTRLDV